MILRLILFLTFFSLNCISQSDTIFTSKQTKIPCKILEINETELKYNRAGNSEGPVYVIEKSNVVKYVLSTGYSETFKKNVSPAASQDDYVKPDYTKITSFNGLGIKLQPFGFSFDHLALTLEKVVNKEMNFELEGGYINSSFNPSANAFINRREVSYNGVYIKPGIKALFARDRATLEKNDFHPFNGGYFRLDLAYSDINYRGLTRTANNLLNGNNNTTITVSSDLHTSAYGVFFNFGYQLIIARKFSIDWYAGVGYTGQKFEYSNPDYLKVYGSGFFVRDDISDFNFYHGFLRAPYIGLSFASAFKIGYVISGNDKKIKN